MNKTKLVLTFEVFALDINENRRPMEVLRVKVRDCKILVKARCEGKAGDVITAFHVRDQHRIFDVVLPACPTGSWDMLPTDGWIDTTLTLCDLERFPHTIDD